MAKTIYLSGPISNTSNAKMNFGVAENYVRSRGHLPLNPMMIEPPKNSVSSKEDWYYFMKKSISLLVECDAIYLLNYWEKSEGAKMEFRMATDLGMPVYFECNKERLRDESKRTKD